MVGYAKRSLYFCRIQIKRLLNNKLNDSTVKLSEEDEVSYRKLAALDLFRNLVKKAIMTIPYNAAPPSIIEYEYIKESLEREPNPDYKKKYKNKK